MSEILPTTVVGSYPQPDWLVDRDALKAHRDTFRYPLEQALA